MALGTQVLFATAEVRCKFGRPVFSGTRSARGGDVSPTVEKEQGLLFWTEVSRSSAVEVGETISREDDRIIGGDRLGALRANPRLLHRCPLSAGDVITPLSGV
jgi:hypothetical protein